MKPLSKREAEAALRSKDWRKLGDALKRLPADVDAELAASVVLARLDDRAWAFARTCQHLPASVIRALHGQLQKSATKRDRILLVSMIDGSDDDAALRAQWAEALKVFLDLDLTYGWGSKQRKERFQALAKRPRVVRAIQAAVVGDAANPSLDMLAVLSIEASDASVDALIPIFAGGSQGTWLELLRTHASKTPALTALLDGQTARREEKERTSPAVAFVQKVLKLDEAPETVSVRVTINSVDENRNGVPLYQGSLSIDSKYDGWWSVHVSRVDDSDDYRAIAFGLEGKGRDAFGLGTCTIEELPSWLAAAQKKLKIRWHVVDTVYGSLRGKKREQLAAWLFSAVSKTPSPPQRRGSG
ncbi:MAG: hypothetical protein U0228_02415 [Myxococcaceae bacterium]